MNTLSALNIIIMCIMFHKEAFYYTKQGIRTHLSGCLDNIKRGTGPLPYSYLERIIDTMALTSEMSTSPSPLTSARPS